MSLEASQVIGEGAQERRVTVSYPSCGLRKGMDLLADGLLKRDARLKFRASPPIEEA
jgi:hypothetical protein